MRTHNIAMTAFKPFERSVDTLQRLYAIIVALALTEGARQLLRMDDGVPHPTVTTILQFIGLVITIIPFLHGMNRHIDATYVFRAPPIRDYKIVVDFVCFLVASLVFAIASHVLGSPWVFWILIGVVLICDTTWVLIFHRNHSKHAIKWSMVNYLCGSILIVVSIAIRDPDNKFNDNAFQLSALMLCVMRSVIDYGWGWRFYFPVESDAEGITWTGPSMLPQGSLQKFSPEDELAARTDNRFGASVTE